jgi:2-keto-4-pentenoate hydratase
MSSSVSSDPRIVAGMRAQLAARQALVDDGARPIGWKIGFGSPAAMTPLGITGPLVGFLVDRGLVTDGGSVSIGAWTAPRLEPELAVRIGADGSIDAFAAAIELADLDGPMDDVEAILRADVFQRHVVLGAPQPATTLPAHSTVTRDGEQFAASDDPLALPGDPFALVTYVAGYLEAVGSALTPGDWIITGTIVPVIEVAPGATFEHRLDPLGSVSVTLTP